MREQLFEQQVSRDAKFQLGLASRARFLIPWCMERPDRPGTAPEMIEDRKSPHVDIRWLKDIERVLITEQQLARRISEMTQAIQRDFSGREMVVVSVLSGTVMFLADLIRHLNLPMRLDFMGV
jgi:hypothetical protein